MIPLNLGELLRASAQKHPGRPAIVFGRKIITYRELDALTDRIASGLLRLGIPAQSKIALFLDNCPEFIIGYYSILKASCTVVPINYMFKMEEAKYILQDSQAICIIASRINIEMAEELRLRVDSLKHIVTTVKIKEDFPDFAQLNKNNPPVGQKHQPLSDSLAVLLYTSGTMGFPKGAMLTHSNLISNAYDSSQAIRVTPRDCFICILPLFHSFAATVCMNLPLLAGAKIVVMKSLRPFKRVIRTIRRQKVTIFVGVPSIYNILKNTKIPRILNNRLIRLINPVRLCISGAAALPVDVFRGFEKKFRIPLLEGYGLTEASPVVTLNPLKGVRKAGSIGVKLSKQISLKIVDEKGRDVPVETIGELLVKGPNVMQGYYHQPEANRETIKHGWLYTGDMAKFDSQDYVYIVGRKKEMINVRGLNVYPREIEEALYQNQKVKEAAVIGIDDSHRGEAPKAFIVLKETEKAGEQEILGYLRERLAAYKIPKSVEFRSSLPKNATGKILKRILKDEEKK